MLTANLTLQHMFRSSW